MVGAGVEVGVRVGVGVLDIITGYNFQFSAGYKNGYNFTLFLYFLKSVI